MDDVNAIFELLPLQERMQVVEQELEVVLSVSVGNDDGRAMPRHTVRRPVLSSAHHQRILPLNLGQTKAWREADVDRPSCEKKLLITSKN